jgi:hypothetical protein
MKKSIWGLRTTSFSFGPLLAASMVAAGLFCPAWPPQDAASAKQ